MKLDKRQKIILVIFIILVAFLVWQLRGLWRSPKPASVKPVLAKPAPTEAHAPITPPPGSRPPLPSLADAVSPPAQPQLIPPQQAEYLRTVDAYQLAQVKRMLAEQVAATAQADATTAKAKAETNKIVLGEIGGAFS